MQFTESPFSAEKLTILLLGKELGSQVLLFFASNIISNLNLMNSPQLKFNKKEEEYYQSSENK